MAVAHRLLRRVCTSGLVPHGLTLYGQKRPKPVGKGHSNVSPEAEHCLRCPRPQTSRLQSCGSRARHRRFHLPMDTRRHKVKKAAGARFQERTTNKCGAGTLYGLGTSCSSSKGHEGKTGQCWGMHAHMHTCWFLVHIATLLTSLAATQALSSCQLTTCFLLRF